MRAGEKILPEGLPILELLLSFSPSPLLIIFVLCSVLRTTARAGEEAKIVLLWSKMMELLCRQLGYGTPAGSVTPIIRSLLPVIFRASEDKASDGLLGAIGLGKRSLLSVE